MATNVHNQTCDITFPVTGMTCASCVRRIERALGKVEGVQEASVNLATEKARVIFDPALVGLPQLSAAVERAGYKVGPMSAAHPASTPGPAATTASSATTDEAD